MATLATVRDKFHKTNPYISLGEREERDNKEPRQMVTLTLGKLILTRRRGNLLDAPVREPR